MGVQFFDSGSARMLTVIASAMVAASCQLVRPSPPATQSPPPQLTDLAAVALESWVELPGARPTALGEPVGLSDALRHHPGTEPRLDLLQDVLEEHATRISASDRRRVAEELARAEEEHGLDALLLLALIDHESRYDPRARGPRGSLGLMQIRPFVGEDVARRLGIPWEGKETLVDPALNVRIGVGYLAEMKQMYTEEKLALAAYNMGPYRVKRILARGRAPRSRYAVHVLARYQELRERFLAAAL